MKTLVFTLAFFFGINGIAAQVDCDPSLAPQNLNAVYTPGVGALLTWDVVPGSQGVQLKVDLPAGSSITKRLVGFERDQFLVPDLALSDGTYTWRVQAACSTVFPFALTPISSPSSFTKGDLHVCPATVVDADGNVYATVLIGDQCWMGENLKVSSYRNGDPIPTGFSNAAWQTTMAGAYSVYDNNPLYKPIFGLLYNAYAVSDPRGLCPADWHVATDGEWTDLTIHQGGAAVAGGTLKTTGNLLAGTGWWRSPNAGATNSSNFSAQPGSTRFPIGNYGNYGYAGYWWSSTAFDALANWYVALSYGDGQVYRASNDQHFGFSVRCIKD
ncbi:MAG: hypothetical protein GC205_11705 [Bacteroidetes bacterium]|nr:hypothetical protein [Bacteroidota bacterium]